MSETAYCITGIAGAFVFIILFIVVWRIANPSGEPGILERATAAFQLFREANTSLERAWAITLGLLLMLKGGKGLIIAFFIGAISSVSASLCGYDPLKLVERFLDFLEKILFGSSSSTIESSDGV